MSALSRAAVGTTALTLAAALLTVSIPPGLSALALARASAVTVCNGNTELLEVRSMEILKLILENWLIFVIVVVLLGLTVYAVLRFLKLTPQQQLDKIRIALLYMVTEAEKELKRKTGQVKRAMVWDWLVERFPIITLFITEEKYDELLDEALEKFKKMLESNSSLYDYVYNTVTVSDEDTEDDILRKITEGA